MSIQVNTYEYIKFIYMSLNQTSTPWYGINNLHTTTAAVKVDIDNMNAPYVICIKEKNIKHFSVLKLGTHNIEDCRAKSTTPIIHNQN